MLERAVGMPQLVAEIEQVAAVVPCEHLPFGIEVGDVGDIRAQPHLGAGIVWIDLERPEEPTERQLLFVAHRLPGKHKDTVAIEGCVDLREDLGHYRAGQIDAADFGAESRVKRSYRYRHVAPLPCAVPLICAAPQKRSI